MDAIEIGEFLDDQRTGVLVLGKDDDGYGVPVSYVYDHGDPAVYMRLGYAPGSTKREYVDAADHVSFVVYDDTDEGYKSVVARGPIEEVAHDSLASSVVEAVRGLDIPYFRVHAQTAEEMEFTIARIDVTSLDGIVEGDA